MNKIYNINLGGYPFTIDEDAYQSINKYLQTIHRHFKDSEGRDEIISDIESRIAELFNESSEGRPIINLSDVERAIQIMGTPEEFGADSLEEDGRDYKREYKTGKKLYRDGDDKVIAGVCSGVAAYFGFRDPILVRIIFALSFLTGGVGVPLYFILWAIMPSAKTSSHRLAMRGEEINVSNIAKTVEDEISNLGDTLSEIGKGFTSKKSEEERVRAKRALREGFSILGKVIGGAFRFLSSIIRPLVIFFCVILLIALVGVWIGLLFGFFYSVPLAEFFLPGSGLMAKLGLLNVFFLIAIPIALLVMSLLRPITGGRIQFRNTMWLVGFMILNAVSFFYVASKAARYFSEESSITSTLESETLDADTIRIEWMENPFEESVIRIGPLIFSENKLISEQVSLGIEKSEGTDFEFVKAIESRGSSKGNAKTTAEHIRIESEVGSNFIRLMPFFEIPAKRKWRAQNVRYTIKVPTGKYITVESRRKWYEHLGHIDIDGERFDQSFSPNHVYQMSENGLILPQEDK